METLLRGCLDVNSLSGVSVSPQQITSRDVSRRSLAVSRARATGADQGKDSRLKELLPTKRTENVVGIANIENAECLLFASRADNSSAASNSMLLSVSPLPFLALAALPGAEQITGFFTPSVEIVRTWNLPEWLIHWGHPGNMAVVLLAMGGYGTFLGWQIRVSDDLDLKAKAKDLHPKLFAGLFFFFAAGALGGVTALLTEGKSIFESNHALTGIIGLALLATQTTLSAQFEGKPELRSVHAYLGSGTMALFLVHAALGLQLGLSP